MNAISHKQAIKWTHRGLDGLLTQEQVLLLEEHLGSCEACRAYASEIDLLPTHLQSQFHARWDERSGPSQKVLEHVTARAKRIPVMNRLSSGIALVGAVAMLIALAFFINFVASELRNASSAAVDGEIATSPPLAQSRLLAFASDQNGNSDIYTVHPDGSGMINLTDNPARDSNPVWSPNGTRIAFESDRDGFTQIYLMNADGSNLIQLTHDEANHFLPLNMYGESNPWSPDGSRLLFIQQGPEAGTSTLHSMDINNEDVVMLADGTLQFNNVSWSPDGKYVGYILNDSPTPDATFVPGLYTVDATGSNPIAISQLMPQTDSIDSPFYYWSRDGSSMIFIAYRHLDETSHQWIAYEAAVESQQLIERATSSTRMEDWWEGTSFIGGNLSTLTWLRADGTFDTFQPFEICDLTVEAQHSFLANRSPNGSQVINIACPNKDMWFYYANSDGTIIKPLMNAAIPSFGVDTIVTGLTWSLDDQFIAATQVSPTKSSLYILNVENPSNQPVEVVISEGEFYTIPSWRPVSNNEVVEDEPTPVPPASDRLIAFTSPQDGASDIFLMNIDGSGLQNITNNPATDRNPVWSPDGTRLALESDRNGKFDVFVMNADGSNLTQITSDLVYDVLASSASPWSPDGTRLVIQSNMPGHEALYVVSADGTGEPIQISDTPGFITWSPDGSQVAYSYISENSGLNSNYEHDAVRIINADGSNKRDIIQTSLIRSVHWSPDGQALYYLAAGEPFVWDVQRVSAEGGTPETVLSFGNSYEPGMAWFSADSSIVYASTGPQGVPTTFFYRLEAGKSSLVGEVPNQSEICGPTAVGYVVVSHDTSQAISYIPCDSGEVIFTAHDLVNNTSVLLGKLPLVNPEISVDWSQDDQVITIRTVQSDVSMNSGSQANLYVLYRSQLDQPPATLTPVIEQTNGLTRTAIQPVPNRKIVSALRTEPTQAVEPTRSLPLSTGKENGEWIALIGLTTVPDPLDSAALTDPKDVYLVHPDGTGLINITNSPDAYFWPEWSPSGKDLLFLRSAGTIDILRKTESNGFEVLVSTEMSAEINVEKDIPEKPFHYSWSPNSEQIAFLEHRAGNYDIYTIYADGRSDPELKQLTNDPGEEFGFVWSPDGSQIAYQKTDGEQLSIMVTNADGSNQHGVAYGAGQVNLRWSRDGKSLYASSAFGWPPYGFLVCEGCATEPAIYQIDLDGPSIRQIYYEEDAEYGWVLYDTPQNQLYFMRIDFDQPSLGMWGAWKNWDGNSIHEIGEMDPQQTCKTTTGNILNEHISPNERFSVITNSCAGGFDLYLADREATTPQGRLTHLLRLPLDTIGEGANDAWLPVGWSPDGRVLIYHDGRGTTYFLDIERAIQDPDSALTPFMEPIYETGPDGLQYQSPETMTIWSLIWQPAP